MIQSVVVHSEIYKILQMKSAIEAGLLFATDFVPVVGEVRGRPREGP